MKDKISKIIAGTALCSMIATTSAPVFAYTKSETVYSKLDNEGNAYKTIVTTHIENSDNEQIIEDLSNFSTKQNGLQYTTTSPLTTSRARGRRRNGRPIPPARRGATPCAHRAGSSTGRTRSRACRARRPRPQWPRCRGRAASGRAAEAR